MTLANAYLNTPCKEKNWVKSGAECGEQRWKVMIVVRYLYGLKMSDTSWKSIFKEFIEKNLHFKLTRILPDVYIRRNRRETRTEYYELLLVYMEDFLSVSHSPEIIMKDI